MKKSIIVFAIIFNLIACKSPSGDSTNPSNQLPDSTEYIIVDHRTSSLTGIPAQYINDAKNNLKLHFTGQSHSGQILGGLELIYSDDTTYDYNDGWYELPNNSNVLCIYGAQESGNDFTFYTGSATGSFTNALTNYSAINISVFVWCRDLDTASTTFVQNYLTQMTNLETTYPGVRFIYCTGNADAQGADGATRYHNNELIRQHVKQGYNRILFDFEDLDSWRYSGSSWQQNTYIYNSENIPLRQSSFIPSTEGGSGAEYNWSHATEESCRQKGRAFWYLMARLAGWDGT